MTEVPIPEFNEGIVSTLAEAKKEYQFLLDLKAPKFGWAPWLYRKIEDRKTCLRSMITDIVMKGEIK